MMRRRIIARLLLVAGIGIVASALLESPVQGDTPKPNSCCQHATVIPIVDLNDPSTQFDLVDCGFLDDGVSGLLVCSDLGTCNMELIDSIKPFQCMPKSGLPFICKPNFQLASLALNDWVLGCSDTSGLATGCLCVATLNSMILVTLPDCGGDDCPPPLPPNP